jgi:hypothetical protein
MVPRDHASLCNNVASHIMRTEPTFLRKRYTAPYVLDRGKLSRMVTIVEQQLTAASTAFTPAFSVDLQNGKNFVLHSLQDVFAIDNSVKNPIRKLVFFSAPDYEYDHDVILDNAETRVRFLFDSDKTSNIMLTVTSPDTKTATELSAELEEQIDRTIVTSWAARFSKRFFATIGTLVAFVILGSLIRLAIASDDNTLKKHSPAESADLQRILSSAKTETEKIDALVQARLHELRSEGEPTPFLPIGLNAVFSVRGAFIVLPILVLIGTLVYVIVVCYPWAVFSWGDYEQHYASLVGRRKTLGIVIVSALVIGIMSNLFVAALSIR